MSSLRALISREPLLVPLSELESTGKLTIGNALLKEVDEQPAKALHSAAKSFPVPQ